MKKLFERYQEIAKKYNATITSLHDEVVIDAPPEHVNEVMTEIANAQMEHSLPILHTSFPKKLGGKFDVNSISLRQIPRTESKEMFRSPYRGIATGRMSSKEQNRATYPRELNEPYCEGCGRELPILRRDVPSVEWRAYHIIPEEGSEYYCRREAYSIFEADKKCKEWKMYWLYSQPKGYDEDLLNKYEAAQQLADRRNPNFQKSKELLEQYPHAATNWSQALRIKILESEQKAKIEENTHWDPYGDWED